MNFIRRNIFPVFSIKKENIFLKKIKKTTNDNLKHLHEKMNFYQNIFRFQENFQ